MASVLLLLAMIASTGASATTAAPGSNVPSTPQSSSVAIQTAQRFHNRVFIGYVLLLTLTVIGTYLVWSSGNKVQEAIQAEANARISEADAKAAAANEKAEAEKLARVRIEERLGGWRLGPEAQARITEKLKPFAGTPFDLSVNPMEERFMETLDSILLGAG
jgi:hypothetical protein